MANPQTPIRGAAEELEPQGTLIAVLQAAAVANGPGTPVLTDGLNGALNLLISNGAGSCTVTIEGSYDNFATAQDVLTLGCYKLADSGAGTNTARTVVSGALAVAANTSYLVAVADSIPYLRARISAAAGLGAGSAVTGCTVTLYGIPS